MSLIKKLIDFGLSDKEARVYLALLELEVATAQEIAKTADINRSSAYVVLESLCKRGLATTSAGEAVLKYVASSPETLLKLASDASERQIQAERDLNSILPELKSQYKGTKRKPKIRIYEGKNGVINAFEESLDARNRLIRVISSGSRLFSYFPEYIIEYVKKRARLGIRTIGIHPLERPSHEISKSLNKNDVAILIPQEKYTFLSEIAIYDNKVGFVSISEEFAIIIEDEHVSKAMESAFNLAAEEAKRLGTVLPSNKNR